MLSSDGVGSSAMARLVSVCSQRQPRKGLRALALEIASDRQIDPTAHHRVDAAGRDGGVQGVGEHRDRAGMSPTQEQVATHEQVRGVVNPVDAI